MGNPVKMAAGGSVTYFRFVLLGSASGNSSRENSVPDLTTETATLRAISVHSILKVCVFTAHGFSVYIHTDGVCMCVL